MKIHRYFTEEEKQEMGEIYLSNSNFTYQQIADRYQTSKQSINNIFQRRNIRRLKYQAFTTLEKQEIIDAYLSGITSKELAQKYGRTTASVGSLLQRCGIKRESQIRHSRFTTEEKKEIVDAYLSGATAKELAQKYGRTIESMASFLTRCKTNKRKTITEKKKTKLKDLFCDLYLR